MTKTEIQAYKYEQIEKIVKDCEEACETELFSDWKKKEELKIAYKAIAEIVLEEPYGSRI